MANTKSGNPTNGQREDAISRLMQGTAWEDPALRAAAARAFGSRDTVSDSVSRLAMAGLLGLTGMALAGTLWVIADGKPDTQPEFPLAAFVGLLGGLLGLLTGATHA
jgi:hypothetical protein